MSSHDLQLANLGVWIALAALAAVQFAAEMRWCRRHRRRTAPVPYSNPTDQTPAQGTP